MQYYEVAPNRIVRKDSDVLTYSFNAPLQRGQLVVIEIGKTTSPGIVMREVGKPDYDTKPIVSLIEDRTLPEPLLTTAEWMTSYYGAHFSSGVQTLLPTGLTKTRRASKASPLVATRERTNNVFTADQARALETIEAMSPGTALLHGVTGSGKTRVYIELARRSLERGQSVIVLVPEIALTSQLVDEFSGHFADIILTHSRQTEAERHHAWRAALTADGPRVAIGPRSALFLPLAQVGLIVIDEAHEPSFKQEQAPRYSALRVASVLAGHHQAKLILGSATPLIADYYLAEHAGRPIIPMTTRAQTGTVPPTITLVDMTKRTHFKRHRFLSDTLLAELEHTFSSGTHLP